MNRLIVTILVILSAASAFETPAQDAPTFTVDDSGNCALEWPGVANRTYFIRHSSDMVHWQCFPVVKRGTGAPERFEFTRRQRSR